jgi:hypothetical protein
MHHESVENTSSAFESALLALATQYNIHADPLPSSVEVAISRQQAEAVALPHSDGSPDTNLDSMLVNATHTAYGKQRPDGTLDLIISNRAVWLVLVPNQQVRSRAPKNPPAEYSATLAVLVDANSGEYLTAAVLAA